MLLQAASIDSVTRPHRTFLIVDGDIRGFFSGRSENTVQRVHRASFTVGDTWSGRSMLQTLKKAAQAAAVEVFSMRPSGTLAARTQRRTNARSTAFLALILVPTFSSAAIYKCTAPDDSITYTDAPCPADATTQYIDPAAPPRLDESSQILNTSPLLPDVKYESQPEILAMLCAADEFRVWLKAQRHGLPERDVRASKFIRFRNLCRRALDLPHVAPL